MVENGEWRKLHKEKDHSSCRLLNAIYKIEVSRAHSQNGESWRTLIIVTGKLTRRRPLGRPRRRGQ